jgi:hypothetical protein
MSMCAMVRVFECDVVPALNSPVGAALVLLTSCVLVSGSSCKRGAGGECMSILSLSEARWCFLQHQPSNSAHVLGAILCTG